MRFDRRELVAVFAGGFAGTVARAEVALAIPFGPGRWPWATFAVNIVGALLLGYFTTRLQERLPLVVPPAVPRNGHLRRADDVLDNAARIAADARRWPTAAGGLYAVASLTAGFAAIAVATNVVRRAKVSP